jgi:tRNA(adenine34) deaminase
MSFIPTLPDHFWFMGIALEEAEKAYRSQEVPVGAILVSPTGDILSKQFNLKEINYNPAAHAEILCISEAAKKIQNWRLSDCTLYVTLEPCPMCLSAMGQARIRQCVFGAYDSKGGAISLGYEVHKDKRLNHQFSVLGGIRHYECSRLLSQFFRERRTSYRSKI